MVLLDVATGLVTNAVHDGLRASVSEIRFEIGRRGVVKKALSGTQSPSTSRTLSEKSLTDLAKVLGGSEGAYTENTEKLINELRRTFVAEAILQLLIAGQNTEEAFPAFLTLYKSCEPLPFEAKSMYDALSAAIRYRLETTTKDPVMLEVVRAYGADLNKQIRELRAYLNRAGDTNDVVPIDLYLDACVRIARAIEAANKELPVETMRGSRRIPIARLAIPSRLRRTDARSPETPASRHHDQSSTGLTEFRRTVQNAVILGDPGGGKSTSTQLLCYDLSKNIIQNNISRDAPRHPKDLVLPLRIIVRSLDGRQQRDPAYSILDYMTDDFRAVLDNNREFSKSVLNQTLSLGAALVIFDGLDEILDLERRRSMAAQIEQFCAIYRGCSVLVTSRVVGYRDAPLGERFQAFTLSRFNHGEIIKYAYNLIKAIRKCKLSEAKSLAETFYQQTGRLAEDLRENPLLLGLMVYIFTEKGSVPDNRPEIYKQCSLLMFEKWDSRRGIRAEIDDDFTLMDLFGHVAVSVFGNPELEEGVDRSWLVSTVFQFFYNWYGDKPRAVRASNKLADFITGRAWVMCDVGPDRYKFTHRTFMEYFVARHIENGNETASGLIETLLPRIVKGEWDVVSQLALQMSAESSIKSAKICDALTELCREDREINNAINVLTFSSQALDYINVPEPKSKLLADTIFESIKRVSSQSFIAASYVIGSMAYHSNRKRSLVESSIKSLVRKSCRQTDRDGSFARFLLGVRVVQSPSSRGDDAYATEFGYSIFEMLDDVRSSERAALHALAGRDRESAAAYWTIYGDKLGELYKIHGSDLLLTKLDEKSGSEEYVLAYAILSASLEDWIYRPLHNVAQGKTISTVPMISKDIVRQGLVSRGFLKNINLDRAEVSPYLRWAGESLVRVLSSQEELPVEVVKIDRICGTLVLFLTLLESENPTLLGSIASSEQRCKDRRAIVETLFPALHVEALAKLLSGSQFANSIAEWLLGEKNFTRAA